jgi:hypothetical protein
MDLPSSVNKPAAASAMVLLPLPGRPKTTKSGRSSGGANTIMKTLANTALGIIFSTHDCILLWHVSKRFVQLPHVSIPAVGSNPRACFLANDERRNNRQQQQPKRKRK